MPRNHLFHLNVQTSGPASLFTKHGLVTTYANFYKVVPLVDQPTYNSNNYKLLTSNENTHEIQLVIYIIIMHARISFYQHLAGSKIANLAYYRTY